MNFIEKLKIKNLAKEENNNFNNAKNVNTNMPNNSSNLKKNYNSNNNMKNINNLSDANIASNNIGNNAAHKGRVIKTNTSTKIENKTKNFVGNSKGKIGK